MAKPPAQDDPPEIIMMPHAVTRYRERIGDLDDEAAIQAWAQQEWGKRNWRESNGQKTWILKRQFKDRGMQEFLACRSPTGKPVFLALDEYRTVALTTLDMDCWNNFIGTKPNQEIRERERIIEKLKQTEKQGFTPRG